MISSLQLGEEHLTYGSFTCASLSARSAWAISIGAAKDTPSAWAKGDPDFANEDGLLVAEAEQRTLLAVADAHFGRLPSHRLLTELHAALREIPTTPEDLTGLLHALAQRPAVEGLRAGTSLLVLVYDQATRRGFGASYWDSTAALVGPNGHRNLVPERAAGIVYLAEPATLEPTVADRFEFTAQAGDLLLAYTDGIDECHYNQAETSVTPAEMERLYRTTGGEDPQAYLSALVELALTGVEGNPGGEDNIAAIALRT